MADPSRLQGIDQSLLDIIMPDNVFEHCFEFKWLTDGRGIPRERPAVGNKL